MAERVFIEGLETVTNNLNHRIKQVKGATIAGLLAGGLVVQAEAQRNTPVLTGNLKGSAFTRKDPENDKAVEVGFGAAYAIYVHENLTANHDNGKAKFLEDALKDKKDAVLEQVVKYARAE